MNETAKLVEFQGDEDPSILKSGEYGFWSGNWWAVPPGTDLCANLAKHEVVVNENGTISVSPSILVSDHKSSWHGFLEKGVWREC